MLGQLGIDPQSLPRKRRLAADQHGRHGDRVEGHRHPLPRRIPVELRAREHPGVPRRQILVDTRRRGLPEARPSDVDVEEAFLGIVARAAAVEVAHAVPEARQLVAREREVGREALGVERAARHRLALRLEALVVVRAPIAREYDEGLAAGGVLEPAEDLDQAERDVDLVRIALRADDVAEARELVRGVGAVLPPIVDGRPVVGVGVHERQCAVAHDEEAGSEEQRGQHYRMKARTSPARASVIRTRAIGMRLGGSRSGRNHSHASDSGPQAISPPVMRHSNDELM